MSDVLNTYEQNTAHIVALNQENNAIDEDLKKIREFLIDPTNNDRETQNKIKGLQDRKQAIAEQISVLSHANVLIVRSMENDETEKRFRSDVKPDLMKKL
ncbi:MAG: hypothetical protein HY981_00185 [Candidatus Magasanikbacteria bacterium]|nr:hypothetical protein [Candidatus Magasanikbacteria bacterium]